MIESKISGEFVWTPCFFFLLGWFLGNRYDSVIIQGKKSHQLQYWGILILMHTAKIFRTATTGHSVRALIAVIQKKNFRGGFTSPKSGHVSENPE